MVLSGSHKRWKILGGGGGCVLSRLSHKLYFLLILVCFSCICFARKITNLVITIGNYQWLLQLTWVNLITVYPMILSGNHIKFLSEMKGASEKNKMGVEWEWGLVGGSNRVTPWEVLIPSCHFLDLCAFSSLPAHSLPLSHSLPSPCSIPAPSPVIPFPHSSSTLVIDHSPDGALDSCHSCPSTSFIRFTRPP